jgi:hypothetical protein
MGYYESEKAMCIYSTIFRCHWVLCAWVGWRNRDIRCNVHAYKEVVFGKDSHDWCTHFGLLWPILLAHLHTMILSYLMTVCSIQIRLFCECLKQHIHVVLVCIPFVFPSSPVKKTKITAVGDPPRWPRATPLSAKNLALTSPTSGGRLVGIVYSQTQTTEFSFIFLFSLSAVISPHLPSRMATFNEHNFLKEDVGLREHRSVRVWCVGFCGWTL